MSGFECPQCGRSVKALYDDPGHDVRERGGQWKPAQACSKCLEQMRAGKAGRVPKTPAPKRRMKQAELFPGLLEPTGGKS